MSLDIEQEIRGSTLFVKIIGTMDYSTIDEFIPEIPEQVTKIVVDFSQLSFIDSTGIGALLSMIYDSNRRAIFVELDGLNETVRELFDTVGVFRIMEALQKRGK